MQDFDNVVVLKNGLAERIKYCDEGFEYDFGFIGFITNKIDVESIISLAQSGYTIHLHRVDYNQTQRRHRQRAAQKWKQADLDKGYSAHQLAVDGRAFDKFYYRHSMLSTTTPIDESMRDVV